ncbi:hypothetical protein, partial [uncultured Microscilla sp.]|uniref:hypothetical protein n=1 Tax=uncultured Microscilla sp. TaxID=432653 RepID=UPI00261076A1
MNGIHNFKQQRYLDASGKSSYFLSSYESKGLRELISFYSNRVSYNDLAGLLTRIVGQQPYCVSHLQNKVIEESKRVATYLHQMPPNQQLSLNFVDEVDIYAADGEEITYLDDGVGVKRQNERRRCKESPGFKSTQRVQTDVIGIGNQKLGFIYLSSAESTSLGGELEDKIHLILSRSYNNKPLPLVAITDGATAIRKRVKRLFGKNVPILLDWYHLEHKVRQYS